MSRSVSDSRVQSALESVLAGRSGEARAYLEGIRAHESHNPALIFLHAYASVLSSEISPALMSAERLRTRFRGYVPGRELSAFLACKSADGRDNAIAAYLELQSDGIKARHIRRLMRRIRAASDFEVFQRELRITEAIPLESCILETDMTQRIDYTDSSELKQKKGKRRIPLLKIAVLIFAAVFLSLLLYAYYSGMLKLPFPTRTHNDFTPVDRAEISGEKYQVIERALPSTPYVYENEIVLISEYNKARMLIKSGETESALLILNRISNSNARMNVKERTRFLLAYIFNTEKRKVRTLSFQELFREPLLYRSIFFEAEGRLEGVDNRGNDTVVTVSSSYGKQIILADIIFHEKITSKNGAHVKISGIFTQLIGNEKRIVAEGRSFKEASAAKDPLNPQ